MVEAQKKKSKQCAISIQLHKSKHDKNESRGQLQRDVQ